MEQSLHDLFTVIITTENAAKYEQQQHNEVKVKIQQKRERLAKQKDSIEQWISKVKHLEEQICGLEIDVSVLKNQERFFKEKLNSIVLETKQNAEKKLKVEEAFQKISLEHMKREQDCIEKFGAQRCGLEHRGCGIQDVIQALHSKNARIAKEMKALHSSWEELLLSLGRKKEMLQQKRALENHIQEVNESIKEESDMTLELELRWKQLKNVPNTDDLFKALKAQLKEYRLSLDNEEKTLLASWSNDQATAADRLT